MKGAQCCKKSKRGDERRQQTTYTTILYRAFDFKFQLGTTATTQANGEKHLKKPFKTIFYNGHAAVNGEMKCGQWSETCKKMGGFLEADFQRLL